MLQQMDATINVPGLGNIRYDLHLVVHFMRLWM